MCFHNIRYTDLYTDSHPDQCQSGSRLNTPLVDTYHQYTSNTRPVEYTLLALEQITLISSQATHTHSHTFDLD
mgnify:CR=1 FL=1